MGNVKKKLNTCLKNRNSFLNKFKNILEEHKDDIPIIKKKKEYNIETNSWFINHCSDYKKTALINVPKCIFPKKVINCKQFDMILSNKQKNILTNWFDSCTEMYNKSLEHIRNTNKLFKNNIVRRHMQDKKIYKIANFYNLRKNMKGTKQIIQQKSKIYTHVLDYSIKQLSSNLKSAITNLVRNNIKRFRIKFWKKNRPSKTIEIEKCYILNNVVLPNVLGEIIYKYNNKIVKLPEINNNVKINYNNIIDKYTLLIPFNNVPKVIKNKKNKLIALDLGLRVFMTGLSEKHSVEIGQNVNKIISNKLEKLNRIKNSKTHPVSVKHKYEKRINRKIKYLVDDLHWKTISYLVKNYKNILLGDMSAKSIVRKNQSILSKLQKVACLRTKYYQFQQRLGYKCLLFKVNYKLVNECYTSKTCSNCCNFNKNLKGEKVFICPKCDLTIDRDINACRNIYLKTLM